MNEVLNGEWEEVINAFKDYLILDRGFSSNSVDAYVRDITKLAEYTNLPPMQVSTDELEGFIQALAELGLCVRSRTRILSSLKNFYRFLSLEYDLENNPASLIKSPRLPQTLPSVLSTDEINDIKSAIDLSKPDGHRNRAIIEVLYSCGLRVSELINLRIEDLFFEEKFIKVVGKGLKQRLVPISDVAIHDVETYMFHYRKKLKIKPEAEDILFLNRNGNKLTRVMIFTIVKRLGPKADIQKNISPHTFRHSFATHLVEGGANLRAVQQMLGHKSIITTEIYTHLDNKFLRETVDKYHPRSEQTYQ